MSDYYPNIEAQVSTLPLFADAIRRVGQAAGEACAAKAEKTTNWDREQAKAEVMRFLGSIGRPASGEEIVNHCTAAGLVPHDARAFGPVIGGLARAGRIEAVGFAARAKGHGTAGARLWRVKYGR
jgi:hypothetical protein